MSSLKENNPCRKHYQNVKCLVNQHLLPPPFYSTPRMHKALLSVQTLLRPLKLLSGRKIQAVKTPVERMRWELRLDYGNNSELFMNSLAALALDVFRARLDRAVRWCRMAVEAVTGEDGDERTAKRCRGGGMKGERKEGGWHPRTNKCLFRIPHGTPLQRVWFPGSTALLMHPSTPVLPPPELRN